MAVMIDYEPSDSNYSASVMIARIVRLSKTPEGVTVIHTDKGKLRTRESMKTIQARIERGAREGA